MLAFWRRISLQKQIASKGYPAAIVFLVAVLLRLTVGWLLIDKLQADPDAYRAIADCLRATGVYGLVSEEGIGVPTAFRPPLYPAILAICSSTPTAILLLHSVLGGWTVFMTYLATQSFIGNRVGDTPDTGLYQKGWAPIWAAVIVLVDPILVHQSTLVMTETLAAAISASVFWWCARLPSATDSGQNGSAISLRWSACLGVMMTVGFLCRPTFLVWSVLLMAGFALGGFFSVRTDRTANGVAMIVSLSILAIGVGGWTLRNRIVMGHPVWATTHGGYTLLLGNNPSFYEYLRNGKAGEVWDSEIFFESYENEVAVFRSQADPVSALRLGEVAEDRAAYQWAKATIVQQPAMFAYACAVRWARLWSPFPHQVGDRGRTAIGLVAVFYVVLYAMVVIGLLRLRNHLLRGFMIAAITLAISLSLIHSVYWSNLRMRAPMVPALAIIAVASCCKGQRVAG